VRVTLPDAQKVVGPDGVMLADPGVIDTILLAEAVHPAALVTVTVYVPLAEAVIAAVAAEPPVAFHR